MAVTVLVVDDSAFFRRRVCELLKTDPRLKPVGTASNGREAIDKTLELKPDVITMDYEMPLMDGITAVREIMARQPTPVLMFSSLTHEGARITLNALEAGAVDYLPKNFEDISRHADKMARTLCERVLAVARSRRTRTLPAERSVRRSLSETARTTPRQPLRTRSGPLSEQPATPGRSVPLEHERRASQAPEQAAPRQRYRPARRHYGLVAIGTSTGGPMALQQLLTRLPANFPAPLVLVQHMPAAFTGAFAERLNNQCQISVKEAQDGDLLRPGLALLAPGGKQMMIDKRNGGSVRILPGDERLNYKPSVDITFGSAARCFPGQVLGIVLTGMGADGREGARLLKEGGSQIWAQDEASSVIYGMPMAVAKANLADAVFSLTEIGDHLLTDVC